jgi:hypothetical protein
MYLIFQILITLLIDSIIVLPPLFPNRQFKALKLFALEEMYDFCFYGFQFFRPFFRVTTSRI